MHNMCEAEITVETNFLTVSARIQNGKLPFLPENKNPVLHNQYESNNR